LGREGRGPRRTPGSHTRHRHRTGRSGCAPSGVAVAGRVSRTAVADGSTSGQTRSAGIRAGAAVAGDLFAPRSGRRSPAWVRLLAATNHQTAIWTQMRQLMTPHQLPCEA
jgi:hypothetical protein